MTKTHQNKSILIVDDEPDILEFLGYTLKKEGYNVYTASDGIECLQKVKDLQPDLVLLDVMMPNMDGVEACQAIRNELNFKDTIIAFLTSRSEDYSQIAGLEAGADDYITKPIRPRVLITKIESLFRRLRGEEALETNQPSIRIDLERYTVNIKGVETMLPKKEFELLNLLASRPGKVFNRDQILQIVWGNDTIVGERTIDVHIRKLREKLGNDYIRTVKGVGYTFNEI